VRLKTIWTLRGMSFHERLNRTGEAFIRSLAHRLPRRLAYWSFIDSGVRYMRSDEVVSEVPYMDLLQRMDKA
jgi:hypothetical protein